MGIGKKISKLIKAIKWHIVRKKRKQFQSKGEGLIRAWLRYSNIKFIEQYEVFLPELPNETGLAFIDFVIKKNKTAIEFNGKQHYCYVPFFHRNGEGDLLIQKERDSMIKNWCLKNGYKFVEIPYTYTADEIINTLKNIVK